MTRLAACLPGLALIAPGLAPVQSGVIRATVLPGQSKHRNDSKFIDLTTFARNGKFLR